ncbi:unnamed protein product [Prorocentrum cordatum]|uniref:Uncharacterized protein n=1 Tax=Prorocentrum cordatum TaxID=2364126 RepID=A0ABN9VRQ4_9DINO|nr:unnamed protein product [Polarella glacialis]
MMGVGRGRDGTTPAGGGWRHEHGEQEEGEKDDREDERAAEGAADSPRRSRSAGAPAAGPGTAATNNSARLGPRPPDPPRCSSKLPSPQPLAPLGAALPAAASAASAFAAAARGGRGVVERVVVERWSRGGRGAVPA